MYNHYEYQKEYRRNNPKKVREWSKKYRENNPEKIIKSLEEWKENNPEYNKQYHLKHYEKEKQYYIDNRDKILKQCKQYRKDNLEKKSEYDKQYAIDNHKRILKYQKQWQNNRRKTNPKYNLKCKISTAIWKSLKGNKAGRHWETLVGYTLDDLIKHLNKTIPKGHCWQDYINTKLQIDHIMPISVFNFTKSEHTDFKRCWALDNLRLLPARENLIKHNKLKKSFQPALAI